MQNDEIFEFAESSENSVSELKPYTVYIVDDDEGVLKTTKDALEHLTYKGRGISLQFFRSAAETIGSLRNENPLKPEVAVIILDMVMEDMGFEVIQFIRNKQENQITQIITRTGQAGKEIQAEQLITEKYEINDFIDKSESSFKRIHTAVTTSLRMYDLLLSLEEAQRNLELFNASLVSFFNLKKDKQGTSDSNADSIISCIFNYLNTALYNGHKKLSEEAFHKLKSLEGNNIQILYMVLNNALKKSKSNEVLARDIIQNTRESKLQWEKEINWLDKLHLALSGSKIGEMQRAEKFISSETSAEIFKQHHLGTIPDTPLLWTGNLSDLLYLYFALHKEFYISENAWEMIHKELELHYCHKSGPLNSDTLKTYKAKYKFSKNELTPEGKKIKTEEWIWDTPNKDLIDEIINEIED